MITVSPLGDRIKNCEIMYCQACSLLFFGSSEASDHKSHEVMHDNHGGDEQDNSCDGNVHVP